jgi:hypothetical protein
MSVMDSAPVRTRLRTLRTRQWSPAERAAVIAVVATVMGCLYLTAYSLALGDPVPHRIDAALVGNGNADAGTVNSVERVAQRSLVFRPYGSLPLAVHAIDEQNIYAALDLTASKPTLYVASAAGASVARVLEGTDAIDPMVRVVDVHPLAANDPSGVDIFYLMLVTTIIAFSTVFQVRGQAGRLALGHHMSFVLIFALAGSLVLTAVDGPLLHRPAGAYPEVWGILALHLVAAASFASLMAALIGRWAIVPTWLFFVILGNASSGGAVSPPLLPQPFAFLSGWLPSGATVTALRNAIYFSDYQHVRPFAVLAAWATGLFILWLIVSRRRLVRETG